MADNKEQAPLQDGALEFLLHVAQAFDEVQSGRRAVFGNRRNPWARDLSQPLRPEQKGGHYPNDIKRRDER